jgi:integrase/recombinase XerD
MLIQVEGGKGVKDRYAMLWPRLLDILRTYWQRAHPGPWLFPVGSPAIMSASPLAGRLSGRATQSQARQAGQGPLPAA